MREPDAFTALDVGKISSHSTSFKIFFKYFHSLDHIILRKRSSVISNCFRHFDDVRGTCYKTVEVMLPIIVLWVLRFQVTINLHYRNFSNKKSFRVSRRRTTFLFPVYKISHYSLLIAATRSDRPRTSSRSPNSFWLEAYFCSYLFNKINVLERKSRCFSTTSLRSLSSNFKLLHSVLNSDEDSPLAIIWNVSFLLLLGGGKWGTFSSREACPLLICPSWSRLEAEKGKRH